MELLVRKGSDVFVPPGAYKHLESTLAQHSAEFADIATVVLSCFDPATRLMPFVLYDQFMFPAAARVLAGALYQAGFTNTRAVFQLWNRRFRPSQARLGGKPLELLLVSSMQIHSRRAYEAIHDAHGLGEDRPLIIAGGPKAVYEPYHYFMQATAAPDVVCTGEVYVVLDLLNVLRQFRGARESLRTAFERARRAGALESVPGLVYPEADSPAESPVLVDTGLQRLVQHLDEYPDEIVGLRLLEPPHRGTGLSAAPLPDKRIARHSPIVSLLLTQGCKFNCPYCPIPALNQKSWRFRSPEGIVRQLKTVHEELGNRYFFGADDNFFNRRQTGEEILTALARATTRGGHPLGKKARWATEATQHDTYKNRDLLPLAGKAGLIGIWFGIEDLTAELVNKGQKPEVTLELFPLMHRHKIAPMAMMMYHEGQPFYTPGSLYGLINQVHFLRKAGAISIQVTVHSPAVGTREVENTYNSGKVYESLGNYRVPESALDGNHVVVAGRHPSWLRQLHVLGGYATFYNPLNLFRAFRQDRSPLRFKRMYYQILGMLGTLWTAIMVLPYVARLLRSRPRFYPQMPSSSAVPVRQVHGAFPRVPASTLPTPPPQQRTAA